MCSLHSCVASVRGADLSPAFVLFSVLCFLCFFIYVFLVINRIYSCLSIFKLNQSKVIGYTNQIGDTNQIIVHLSLNNSLDEISFGVFYPAYCKMSTCSTHSGNFRVSQSLIMGSWYRKPFKRKELSRSLSAAISFALYLLGIIIQHFTHSLCACVGHSHLHKHMQHFKLIYGLTSTAKRLSLYPM